jgi:hypothetical protein
MSMTLNPPTLLTEIYLSQESTTPHEKVWVNENQIVSCKYKGTTLVLSMVDGTKYSLDILVEPPEDEVEITMFRNKNFITRLLGEYDCYKIYHKL